jgi:hypothetical protein
MEKQEKTGGAMPRLRKCAQCRGQDGAAKDDYETFQAALDTARYIEENRKIYLDVYECPVDSGWHLTKRNADSELNDRTETILQKNGIPVKSPSGLWEFIKDESNVTQSGKNKCAGATAGKPKIRKSVPILKIECKAGTNIAGVSGKVMEIVENVDIEKLFGINTESPFCAVFTKNILDGIVHQITVYAENKKSKQLESYTVLFKKDLLGKRKINKGAQIKLYVTGKAINNVKMWCGTKIELS